MTMDTVKIEQSNWCLRDPMGDSVSKRFEKEKGALFCTMP
jgi:hypothetical protein